MGGKSRAAGQANGFAFLKTANWIQIALEPSAVRRRSSSSGSRPAKWDRFPFRLAKAGRNRAKPVPDLIRDPACCALQSVSNVKLTRHRIPLEFAEKGGYSSYTPPYRPFPEIKPGPDWEEWFNRLFWVAVWGAGAYVVFF